MDDFHIKLGTKTYSSLLNVDFNSNLSFFSWNEGTDFPLEANSGIHEIAVENSSSFLLKTANLIELHFFCLQNLQRLRVISLTNLPISNSNKKIS